MKNVENFENLIVQSIRNFIPFIVVIIALICGSIIYSYCNYNVTSDRDLAEASIFLAVFTLCGVLSYFMKCGLFTVVMFFISCFCSLLVGIKEPRFLCIVALYSFMFFLLRLLRIW